ncbi:hypothetical protein PIB30_082358 [Stylosanthes scabra]|uniref:Uncharacterized protein n=1 Tax=Stylosanthes scabra TaxID=79078 RepID=A0ABU6QRI9_9FABA|nr:hypothetical protein [Stylosanthes scabra]
MGSLQFIPITHGLSDMEFTYGCPNTVCKVKEIIADWKDVRCVKSGVPTSDTTPGYPLWQANMLKGFGTLGVNANRGKGFKAPVVTGPELLIHMFDDPIDYKAEIEYRYENAFRGLEEKELILIQQWERRKNDFCHRLNKTVSEVTEQKEKVKVLEAQFMKMKERCHSLETILGKRNQALKSYGTDVEILRQDIIEKNHRLRVDNDFISFLESENAKLQKNVEQFAATNEKWSEMHTKMEQGTTMLLRDIRDVTCHGRKKAKIVEEAEAMLPPRKIQKMLSELAIELNHIGRFY